MKNPITSLTFALALGTLSLGISSAVVAQQAMTEPQVHSTLTEQGYTKVHDLKFRDGMWYARAGAPMASTSISASMRRPARSIRTRRCRD
jgi:hypothetical protein